MTTEEENRITSKLATIFKPVHDMLADIHVELTKHRDKVVESTVTGPVIPSIPKSSKADGTN